LIDPILNQAGGADVTMLIADGMRRPKEAGKL
jgi:hypothetical protein